jgi:sugar phosphate isomerase/epimerase
MRIDSGASGDPSTALIRSIRHSVTHVNRVGRWEGERLLTALWVYRQMTPRLSPSRAWRLWLAAPRPDTYNRVNPVNRKEGFLMNRREFVLSVSAAATALSVRRMFSEDARYRIGIDANSRTSDPATTWGGDPFRGFRESHEVGYTYMEVFATNVREFFPDDVAELQRKIDEIGVKLEAVTGGVNPAAGPGHGGIGGNTHFEDPSAREEVIKNHLAVVRFAKKFNCDHQKTNLGNRRPEGTTQEDLKNIAETVQILCRRSLEEEGIPFGIHAHLGSQFQTQNEIDYVMENTDPKYVKFILDTGHITMAGMDPLALTKKFGHRIIEFHLKDAKPEDRRGTRHVPARDHDQMKDPYFFPLGTGGVDFPGIKAYLDHIQWKGWLTVELDTSPWRTPKESARISAQYIKDTLKIPF